jgi:hypothetical protein
MGETPGEEKEAGHSKTEWAEETQVGWHDALEMIFCFLDGTHEGLPRHPNNKADIHKSSSNDNAVLPWGPLWHGNSIYNILCTIMNRCYMPVYSFHTFNMLDCLSQRFPFLCILFLSTIFCAG